MGIEDNVQLLGVDVSNTKYVQELVRGRGG